MLASIQACVSVHPFGLNWGKSESSGWLCFVGKSRNVGYFVITEMMIVFIYLAAVYLTMLSATRTV